MTQICVTSVNSVGCTFLDWSIHFLSGQHKFYNFKLDSWIPLTMDPVNSTNAHGHQKNHPDGLNNFLKVLDQFDCQIPERLYSVYPIPLHVESAAAALGTELAAENFDAIKKYQSIDYNQLLERCYQRKVKLIFVSSDSRTQGYFLSKRTKERWFGKLRPGTPDSVEAFNDQLQDFFFNSSISRWEDLGLTNIWDKRERRALDLRLDNNDVMFSVNLSFPHQWIYCQDLWTRGPEVMQKVMHFLDLEILPKRLDQWLPVYQKWQKIQLDAHEFDYNCKHIVESIVNNWYYDIDLTFDQEVMIQHLLIYKHNLNLKTWQLTKFPNNTQELHKLLEPNIHSIPSIY